MGLNIKKFRAVVGSFTLIVILIVSGLAMPGVWATYRGVSLVVDTVSGSPGDDVYVAVSLVGNPGVAGFSLLVKFDCRVLTPLYVMQNPWLGGEVFISNVNRKMIVENYHYYHYYYYYHSYHYYYEWGDMLQLDYYHDFVDIGLSSMTVVWAASANVTTEKLFSICFKINDSALVGSTYISLAVTDLMDASRSSFFADISNGTVYIFPVTVWGNVTGTGYLHVGDLVRLAQYVAGIPGYELMGDSLYVADVDRDGRVTVSDIILVAQYLAVTGDVVLGVLQ